jgi:glycosyltransferase involved in cell wall biosynthesis
VSDPKPDTLVHDQTGLAIPALDPAALAEAIRHFERDRHEVTRMGAHARQLAVDNFDPETNARKLKQVYSRILGISPSTE